MLSYNLDYNNFPYDNDDAECYIIQSMETYGDALNVESYLDLYCFVCGSYELQNFSKETNAYKAIYKERNLYLIN